MLLWFKMMEQNHNKFTFQNITGFLSEINQTKCTMHNKLWSFWSVLMLHDFFEYVRFPSLFHNPFISHTVEMIPFFKLPISNFAHYLDCAIKCRAARHLGLFLIQSLRNVSPLNCLPVSNLLLMWKCFVRFKLQVVLKSGVICPLLSHITVDGLWIWPGINICTMSVTLKCALCSSQQKFVRCSVRAEVRHLRKVLCHRLNVERHQVRLFIQITFFFFFF